MSVIPDPYLDPSWHRVSGLRPRLRSHLSVGRHRYRGSAWYVVEDKASGRIHRFTPAVYLFVGRMDGKHSVDEIWSKVVGQLGDDAPTQGEIIRLLSQLHAADLLQTDAAPDAKELLDRYTRHSRSQLRRKLTNPMSIKIPLWDPDRFLDRTLGLVRPLFSGIGGLVWLATIIAATVAALMHWNELTESMADQIFAAENLLTMALLFPILKLFHELGHGYATKIAGGEVHEMGVMLLVFAPIPYVDASSSAAFSNKWSRALVGAAGMMCELFIAAMAMFIWLAVEPGIVRSVAYHTMLVAGVSTIVFNSNPLLRFDGYYILCDLLEIPNLGLRSTRYWVWVMEHYLFGVDGHPPPTGPGERRWLVFYAPTAFVYRTFVLFGIAIFVASEYFVIGVLIAGWGIISSLLLPSLKAVGQVVAGERFRRRRLRAVSITFAGIFGLLTILFLAPLPLHTVAEGVVWLPEESFVRAGDGGFVKFVAARPGERVSPGDLLFESEDATLATEVKALQSQVAALRLRHASERFADRVQADITRQELEVKENNLVRALERTSALSVRSAFAGTFLVPNMEDLPGRYFKRGEILGYVVLAQSRIARVVVTQDDIDLVRQRLVGIEMRLANRPAETVEASVVREVPAASDRLPSKALTNAGGGRFAIDPRDSAQVRTLQRTFQFDLELPQDASNANFGSRVHVRFNHGWEPLGWQCYRRVRQLFLARFDA